MEDIRCAEKDEWSEGQGIWLAGVRSFENRESTLSHMKALRCVLSFHGEEMDWNWLQGVSGEAFCFYYHPVGTFLTQHVHSWDAALAALRAYGYRGQWHSTVEADISPTLERIENELRQNRPVISPGICPAPDGIHSRCDHWFVVSGIDVKSRKVALAGAGKHIRRVPLSHGDDPSPEGPHSRWFGICRTFENMAGHYGPPRADNPILLVQPETHRPSTLETLHEALQRAVRLAREISTSARYGWGDGTYLSGLNALQRLAKNLEDQQGDGLEDYIRHNPVGPEPFRGIRDELTFLELLADRRLAASGFLWQAASHMPSVERRLDRAAKQFLASSQAARRAFRIRYGEDLSQQNRIRDMIDAGQFGEDNPEWREYWRKADVALASRTNRLRMAQLINEVCEHEALAVKEMEDIINLSA